MLFRIALFFLSFVIFFGASAQKVKDYTINLKYRAMPVYSLGSQYIPMNYKFTDHVMMLDKVIRPIETSTFSSSEKTNYYQHQLSMFSVFYLAKMKTDSTYRLEGEFKRMMVESKKEMMVTRSIMTPNGPVDKNILVYDLEIVFPAKLELFNPKDSIIYSQYSGNEDRIRIEFPTFVQEMFQGYNGYTTTAQLENLWLTRREEFLNKAKDKLLTEKFAFASKRLNENHKIQLNNLGLNIYYLKDKKVDYPGFDSVLNLMKQIENSVDLNYKAKNNLNWHTSYIYQTASQVEKILNRQFYIFKRRLEENEIDKDLGEEIVFGIYKNQLAVLFLMDRYDEGIAQLTRLLDGNKSHKYFSGFYIDGLLSEFQIQKLRYQSNWKKYNWNHDLKK